MQTLNDTGVALGKPDCTVPTSCSTFDLTINSSVGTAVPGYNPTQYQINMTWSWSLAAVDYDIFVEDAGGTVVATNRSTADPSGIILPATQPAGVYHIVIALSTGAPVGYTGNIVLEPKPLVSGLCGPPANCTPPRYQNFSAGEGQSDDAGEPSLGVDWNPNVAALKHDKVNTGGVAFFSSGRHEWRVNFDDCSSPAVNLWEDVSTVFNQNTALVDPIGFVDHYTSAPLGVAYPPPHTPGRVFSMQLLGGQGNSLSGYSDDDGQNYLPGGNGGPGQGPDHETLGGGPYAGTPPPTATYPATGTKNAIYYCSQNIAAEAQCSRSDNGGQTFAAAVLIFTPTQCTGGIHGHIKVAPDGTVYVPNSSCGTTGNDGVAVSTDNGLTWTENNVPASTGSQDPSVGVGQNNVGKPAGNLNGTNTIYLGWVSGDGHAHVAHSGNRGATYTGDTDVGAPFGVTHAVFPVVVAGDDNRAAFAFLGTGDGIATTGSCNPYGAVLNCKNIWHLYIATTYNGGANWITIDATPNDPVQTGTVCLEGTTCAGGRNLLDFNDYAIDAEGRGLVGYADGCVNCVNTFTAQSAAEHGTVTRQSGGRRLFAFFDPVEPAVPAAPQLIKAVTQPSGAALISWTEPDNGGSPITGYKVYRGTTSGGESFLANVSGVTNTKYLDLAPPAGNVFYYVTAVNAQGQSTFCRELMLTLLPPCVQPTGPFFDDLEPAADPGWQVQTPTNDGGAASPTWQVITDPSAHSATHSFFSDASTVQPKEDRLIAPPQNVSATTHLIFWHRFQFEDGYDGGVLEVSLDNGATWVDVVTGGGSFVTGGYNGAIDPGFGNVLAGRAAWTGGDATAAMSKVEVNLGAFAGFNVMVRFRLGCDFLETPGVGWFIDDIQFTNLQSCPVQLSSVVSRKTHGGSATFDVPLQKNAITTPRGVECRTGGASGNHSIVFTFQNNLVGTIGTDVGSASVLTGPGSVVAAGTGIGPAQNQYTVNLTGVTNANYVSVALHNVSDTAGHIGDVATTMGVLTGDVNASGVVTSGDTNLCKAQALQPVTTSNFRDDINASGAITTGDVNIIKQNALSQLPTPP